MSAPDPTEARRAIEALRAGTPNRAAIRLLGNREQGIEARFSEGLDRMWSKKPPPGLLVAGGFGSGKSHLLGHMRELALGRNMVVSWVTVSKETPLFNPGLMHAAAMRGAVMPDSTDDIATAALNRIQRIPGAVQTLELWTASPEAQLSPVFGAVAHLLGRDLSPALLQGIEAFLCGGKPPSTGVRQELAKRGAKGLFDLTGVKALQMDLQRPRFMAQLLQAAGYAGWCLMIDEVELIGRYGVAQRTNAYVQLARWLGMWEAMRIPGLYTLAAITDDFADSVINTRRDDERLPERLRGREMGEQATMAEAIMRAIRAAPTLRTPTDADLARHADVARLCYRQAYGWEPPVAVLAERQASRSMRQHIRGWITEWDMLRLSGRSAGVEVSAIAPDYSENLDLELAPEDDDSGG